MHENRETSASTGRDERTSPAGEGRSRTARMNDIEESDRSVVPVSQPNKAEPSAAEVGEGRGRTKENTSQSHTLSTQREAGVSQGLTALAGLWVDGARASPEEIVIFADEGEKPGEFGYEEHLNYAAKARQDRNYPGETPPQGVFRFMPEVSYGLSETWNLGVHLPMSYRSGAMTVDGFKVRFTNLNIRETDWGSWFYGVNYELSYFDKRLSESRVVGEVLGILGMRRGDWLFVVNPELGRALSSNTPELDKRLDLDINFKVMKAGRSHLAFGIEHYAEVGKASHPQFGGTSTQITYAIVEFKTKSDFDFNIGIGHGWTEPADKLVYKMMVGIPF